MSGPRNVGPEALITSKLAHLRALEAESVRIIREVAAEFQHPVMLYSIGKDSSVTKAASTRLSAARAAMRKSRAPKSASTFSAFQLDRT